MSVYTGTILVLAALLIGGCDAADSIFGDSEFDQLNDTLRVRIESASGGLGAQVFLLPDPGDLMTVRQLPSNPLTASKVRLGQVLFHETELAVENLEPEGLKTYSCASCHHARAGFQAGIPQGIGDGGVGFGKNGETRRPDPRYDLVNLGVQAVRSPAVLNLGYQDNLGWTGRYESVEELALASFPMFRLDVAGIDTVTAYRALFAEAFEVEPEEAINEERAAQALAAYMRTIVSNETPFQEWLHGNPLAMSGKQLEGAILFFGKAGCVGCHSGPALNSSEFYALGFNDLAGPGAYTEAFTEDEFSAGRAAVTSKAADQFAFKTPQLYNLIDSPYYGHGSSFNSVRDVIRYKNEGVAQNPAVPSSQLSALFVPLGLSRDEIDALTAFIETALYDQNLGRYEPFAVPSGNCFPNNDPETRVDRRLCY
ncbi:MAG: cytochrome c peroxidase [Bacteroidota bacterium]